MDREEPDLTKGEDYGQVMKAAVEEKRAWLLDMGYNPDNLKDRNTCEWLAWHLTKRF